MHESSITDKASVSREDILGRFQTASTAVTDATGMALQKGTTIVSNAPACSVQPPFQ
jgi:hypothetical protein